MSHPVTEARGAMSIEVLAERSGVPATTIARIEAGLSATPMRRTLDRLALALDMKPTALALAIAQHNHAQAAEASA